MGSERRLEFNRKSQLTNMHHSYNRISGIMAARFLLHVREWHGADGTSQTNDISALDSGMPSFASAYRQPTDTLETHQEDDDRSYHSRASLPERGSEEPQCSEVVPSATIRWMGQSDPSSSTSRMV
jgi:hypothetical protein